MGKKAIYIPAGGDARKYKEPFTHCDRPYSYFGNFTDRLALFPDYDRYCIGYNAFRGMQDLLKADVYIILMHGSRFEELSFPSDSLKILDCSETLALEYKPSDLDQIDYIFAYRQPDLDYFNVICPEKIIPDMPHVENVSYYEQFYKEMDEKEERIMLWAKYYSRDFVTLLYANKTGLPVHLFTPFDTRYMQCYFDFLNVEAYVHDVITLDEHTEFMSKSKFTLSYRPFYNTLQWGHTIVPSAIVGTPAIGTANVYAQAQLFPDLVVNSLEELQEKIALDNYKDIIGYAKERAYYLFSIDKQIERLRAAI